PGTADAAAGVGTTRYPGGAWSDRPPTAEPGGTTVAGGAWTDTVCAPAVRTPTSKVRSLPPVLAIVRLRETVSPVNRLSLTEPGVTAMSGGTSPVPLRGMLKAGASGSLLAIVSVPA